MIHIFIGTKAQLIKMAPIMVELKSQNIEYNLVFSGQHKNTMDNIRENFGLKEPDYTIYQGNDVTNIKKMIFWFGYSVFAVLKNRKKIWKNDKIGIVLNHGDTFSTLLGSFLAKISGLKSAHIESGLRSFSLTNPFPEEITRLLVFQLSDYYFAPGDWAIKNLEPYSGRKINTKENTLYDSLSLCLPQNLSVKIPTYEYCVASFHRFENLYKKKNLLKIIEIVKEVSKTTPVLVIMHKPTEERLKKNGLYESLLNTNNIELRPRYDYFNFIELVKKSKFVLTDGGSNQEECYYLSKPCIILRNYTERNEGIGKSAWICNLQKEKAISLIEKIPDLNLEENKLSANPSKIIVSELKSYR